MKIDHVYINKEGAIFACTVPVPEEPNPNEYKAMTDDGWVINEVDYSAYGTAKDEYEAALQSCKDSAVRFEDQEEAELEAFKKWFAQSDEDDSWPGLKPDSFYLMNCEIEIVNVPIPCPDSKKGCEVLHIRKVARLITDSKNEPVEEESQDDLIFEIMSIKPG